MEREVRKVTVVGEANTGPCSLTLVQRSCQCVDAAAVRIRGQRVLRGHGRDVVG